MSWHSTKKLPSEVNPDGKQANRILQRFPGRVPVIVESIESFHLTKSKNFIQRIIADQKKLETKEAEETHSVRYKFLVPYDCTVGQFQWILRRKINIDSSKAIYLVVGKSLPHASHLMGELYQTHKKNDEFLYVHYSFESTFGVSHA